MADELKSPEFNAQVDAVATKARELATTVLGLLVKPEPLPTSREKLAPERANRDIQASHDSARAATQAALIINGGAATAILAYLSKDTLGMIHAAAWSLMGYALGVVFGAFSVWCSAQATAKFGYYWESVMDRDRTGQGNFTAQGQSWLLGHRISFVLSIASFVVASFWIALAFLAVKKST